MHAIRATWRAKLGCIVLGFSLSACGSREAPSELDVERNPQGRAQAVLLRHAIPSRSAPHELLRVFVIPQTATDTALPPLVGFYTFVGEDLRFEPRFGFHPEQRYRASTEAGIDLVFAGSEDELISKPTRIVASYPTASEWPENILRIYLHFSAPMSIGNAAKYVHWLDASGTTQDDSFLELDQELWDPSGTRLTLLFDPSRVKRGLVPHEDLGRALQADQHYLLEVDAAWPDAQGMPLGHGLRREIRAVGEDLSSPLVAAWDLNVPPAGTREPLIITWNESLDAALLLECFEIESAGGLETRGEFKLGTEERSLRFVPAAPWKAEEHVLQVDARLEDVCGNRLNAAFEVDASAPAAPPMPNTHERRFVPQVRR